MPKDFTEAFVNQHMAMQERTAAWIRSQKKDRAQPDNPTSPIIGKDIETEPREAVPKQLPDHVYDYYGNEISPEESLRSIIMDLQDSVEELVFLISMCGKGGLSIAEMCDRAAKQFPDEWGIETTRSPKADFDLLLSMIADCSTGELEIDKLYRNIVEYFPEQWKEAGGITPESPSQAESKALGRAMEIAKR